MKQYRSATALVHFVLNSSLDQGKTLDQLTDVSQNGIVKFYQNEIVPLAHLCTKPVTFQNVNRRLEEWIKMKRGAISTTV